MIVFYLLYKLQIILSPIFTKSRGRPSTSVAREC